jgi:hypothetical protein
MNKTNHNIMRFKGKDYKFIINEAVDGSEYISILTGRNIFGYPNTILFFSLIEYSQLHRIENRSTLKAIKSFIVNNPILLEIALKPILKDTIAYQLSIGLIKLE